MRSFLLNKLVKDKVFSSMQQLGQTVTHRTLTDNELLPELQKKLLEEASEFSQANDNAMEELADLLEVVEAAGRALGTDLAAIQAVQKSRYQKRGGFDQKIYIERLDLADDDPWVEYYAADPERFPEIKEI